MSTATWGGVLVLLATAVRCWPAGVGWTRSGGSGRPMVPSAGRFTGARSVVPGAAITAGVGAGVASGSLLVGSAAAAAAATVAVSLGRAVRRRVVVRAEIAALQAVRALAREFRAGASPAAALAAADEAHDVPMIGRLALAETVGRPTAAAAGIEGSLAAAFRLTRTSGIPLAELVGRLADDLDERIRLRRQRAALTAGATMSGHLLTGLPVMGLLLGAGIGADPLPVLLGGGLGSVLLLVGALLSCAGVLWAARIAR